MELSSYIDKYKNRILNVVIIIVALVVANKIYQSQAKTQEALKVKRDTAIKKNEILADIAKLEPKIAAYKKMLTKKDTATLMSNISNIARESEVKIVSLKPQQELSNPLYIRYPFAVVISAGDYHRIGRFLSKLENSPDVYIVDSLNLKLASLRQRQAGPIEKTRPIDEITADLILSTIFLKD